MASQISTFSPYNDGSVGSFHFNGTSDFITIPNIGAAANISTGDFTFECWVNTSTVAANGSPGRTVRVFVLDKDTGNSADNFQVLISTVASIYSNQNILAGTANGYDDEEWHHIAVSRTGGTMYLYSDGTLSGSVSNATNFNPNSGQPEPMIGRFVTSELSGYFTGFISDMRLVVGHAVYSGTSSFTPPTTALTNISGTGYSTALLLQPGKNEDIVTNIAVLKPDKHFDTLVYTGTGTPNTSNLNGLPFKPDLVWIKSRTTTNGNNLFDSVRGAGWVLSSNSTGAQGDNTAYMTGFTNDGVSFGSVGGDTNASGVNYVAWCWKAGGAPSADGVAMVDGTATTCSAIASAASASITPTRMSVNTKAGFSIVKYTGTSNASSTLPHGLETADFVIIKSLDEGTTNYTGQWDVYHRSLGSSKLLALSNSSSATSPTNAWLADPTNVITMGNAAAINYLNDNYIAYCWHSVPGFSKFGSYTGNGNVDGPFVYLGFRPAWVMIKRTDTTGNWMLKDSSRDPYNPAGYTLLADLTDAEYGPSNTIIDILSNGFKCGSTSAILNASGGTYIFMAFAEAPSTFTNAR